MMDLKNCLDKYKYEPVEYYLDKYKKLINSGSLGYHSVIISFNDIIKTALFYEHKDAVQWIEFIINEYNLTTIDYEVYLDESLYQKNAK